MKPITEKLHLVILKIGILFLGYSALMNLLNSNYWQLFSDLEFIGIGLYIIYIYPKRKLKLNADFMLILFVHFLALAIHSFLIKDWIILIISGSACIGYVVYRVYRKRHKYSFYIHR